MSRTILIVDDQEDVRGPIADDFELEFEEDTILTAENGEQALEVIAEHHPEVIIMDINMPVMDGIECCRRIRSNRTTAGIYIIMLTGRGRGMSEGLQVGADVYLNKPCPIEDLIAQVNRGFETFAARHTSVSAMHETTGLFDGQFFMDPLLKEEQARAHRYQSAHFTLVRFRLVEDATISDDTLRRIVKHMALRGSDRAAYMGNGEFVVLLPNTAVEQAEIYVSRLRSVMDHYRLHFGVCSSDLDIDLCMQLAGDALNEAESSGQPVVITTE
ncbi:MAG: response regulator [Magnetococcales bacterium]|nr:response regulator [Magnetococcales bacterium]